MKEKHSPPVRFLNFGCRLNRLETDALRDLVAEDIKEGPWIVLNTCAVTAEALRQMKQTLRSLHEENPTTRLAVVGCGAAALGTLEEDLKGVAIVLGNAEKLDKTIWREALQTGKSGAPYRISTPMGRRQMGFALPTTRQIGRQRAFVQIQQGCDHRCTFCIVPLLRGRSESRPPEALFAHVIKLVENGYQEIVLTGVDIASFRVASGGLSSLVAGILALNLPNLKRLRLSSLDPAALDSSLIDLFGSEERLMPHLHLSLQAGSDSVLRRMARRHRMAAVFEAVGALRQKRKDMLFGADLIAGFPTETDDLFQEGLKALGALDLAFWHVFPFSPRPETPAAGFPQLTREVVKERARILRAHGISKQREILSRLIGCRLPVLWEDGHKGYTPAFAPVESLTSTTAGTLSLFEVLSLTEAGSLKGRAVEPLL